jgi:hypothetical protein
VPRLDHKVVSGFADVGHDQLGDVCPEEVGRAWRRLGAVDNRYPFGIGDLFDATLPASA